MYYAAVHFHIFSAEKYHENSSLRPFLSLYQTAGKYQKKKLPVRAAFFAGQIYRPGAAFKFYMNVLSSAFKFEVFGS